MKKKTEDKTTKKTEKRRLLRTGVCLIVVLVLLIGFSYAWFINRNDITTLMEIQEPSEISILGSNGKRLDTLDLTYQPGEKNADGTVTIRRVFCVQSATDYQAGTRTYDESERAEFHTLSGGKSRSNRSRWNKCDRRRYDLSL